MKKVNKDVLYSLLLLILSILSVLFLWKNTALLPCILVAIELIKSKLIPIKKEFIWYLFAAIASALVEIILVNVGGAWSYTSSSLLGVPIYMPLFWGVLATTIVVVYRKLLDTNL